MLRGQASLSRCLLVAGSGSAPPLPPPPAVARGLSSSSSGDPPLASRRSISAVAVQQRVESLAYDSGGFVGRLDWPAGTAPAASEASGSGAGGELWNTRRRSFKPREGKERAAGADDELDARAAALARLDRMFPPRAFSTEEHSSAGQQSSSGDASLTGVDRPAAAPNPRLQLRQLPSVGRQRQILVAAASPKPPEAAAAASQKDHALLQRQSKAKTAAILLPPPPPLKALKALRRANARPPSPVIQAATPPPPVPSQGKSSSLDVQGQRGRPLLAWEPTPDLLTAQTAASAIYVQHDSARGRPLVLFISPAVRALLLDHYPPPATSAGHHLTAVPQSISRGAEVIAQACGANEVSLLVQALGSGLRQYEQSAKEIRQSASPPPPFASDDGALARECAALIWKCLESKLKSHNDWFWLTRADLELHETIGPPALLPICLSGRYSADRLCSDRCRSTVVSELVTRAQRTCHSAELAHSLPALYALIHSDDPEGGVSAADLLTRAARHFQLTSTAESRAQLEAVFRAILGRLASDGSAGAEGFQRLVWVLEIRATRAFHGAGEQLDVNERRLLSRLAVHLLKMSQSAGISELSLDICARLSENATLAPSSCALTRLGISLADPESMAQLLGQGSLRKRHATLLLDRLLDRLEKSSLAIDDDCMAAVARSLSSAVEDPGRSPALVPGPLTLRLVRFLTEQGALPTAANILLPLAPLDEPASVSVAIDVLRRLAMDRSAGAITLGHRLLEAIPVGQRPLAIYNALLRQANTTFRRRTDADAVTDRIEALLAAETAIAPDLGTAEARLLAPPRSERLPEANYTQAELVAHSDARAQTYTEIWQLVLAQGSTFRPSTWRLVLSAVGREAGYFRAREVVDWMRLHGTVPDMDIWNQVLANARATQGRSGQAMIKVFRTSIRQLVREEPTFQPDMWVDSFDECLSRHFKTPADLPGPAHPATPSSRLSGSSSREPRAISPPDPCASSATPTPARLTSRSTLPAGLPVSSSPRPSQPRGPSTSRSRRTRRLCCPSSPSDSRPTSASSISSGTSLKRTTCSREGSSIVPIPLRWKCLAEPAWPPKLLTRGTLRRAVRRRRLGEVVGSGRCKGCTLT